MSRARDNANLGAQAGSGLDASDITTGVLPVGVTGGSGLTAVPVPADADTISHIIPDVLYPAVANIMVDGSTALSAVTTGPNSSTVASSKYGTVQSDGRMYYYTDIKGSKPIKDPRIGSHFGSQRHTFRSLQLLEQETATHGNDVFSVDGREWIRASWKPDAAQTMSMANDAKGTYISWDANSANAFIEVTGYFSEANWVQHAQGESGSGARKFKWSIDGGSDSSDIGAMTAGDILGGRFVNASSVYAMGVGATLGIHTLKVKAVNSFSSYWFGVELITQDTSNRSNIQIPSQNVVSYGKKFTVSGTPHYNPFAFAGDGTTAVAIGDTTSHGKVADGWTGSTATYFDSTLDTATSLGLTAWETGGDFYRPINGGRVVRWVDSSGNIKTSVNMMPPTGTAIGAASDAALPTSHAWTTVYQPKLSSTTIDHSQAEVAKTFYAREFGNGAANEGNATSGTWQDASQLHGADDIAYVMDDGLTSISAAQFVGSSPPNIRGENSADDEYAYFTFIGTGVTGMGKGSMATSLEHTTTYAQNLPYGTHILRIGTRNGNNVYPIAVDGLTLITTSTSNSEIAHIRELAFHQPKMPPIPEDAVVIADYMLMADFVPQTTAGIDKISKGTRLCSISRDTFADETDGDSFTFSLDVNYIGGFLLRASDAADSDTSFQYRMPAFATNYVARGYQMDSRCKLYVDTTDKDSASTKDNTATQGSYAHLTSDEVLGVQKWGINGVTGQIPHIGSFQIVTPIHTSSHYQTFETPFLHELVGGDRNMEQNNLIVTPDGKTWDEVTRDTSYLGKICVVSTWDTGNDTADGAAAHNMTEWRGKDGSCNVGMMNKDFAIAFDRVYCLVSGEYHIMGNAKEDDAGNQVDIRINGSMIQSQIATPAGQSGHNTTSVLLKRGDYVQLKGRSNHFKEYNRFIITRV